MGANALGPVCCPWSGRPAAGCCRLWAAALGGRAPRCAGRGRWRGLGVWVAVRPSGSLFAPRRGGSPSALCCFGRPASRLLSRFMFIIDRALRLPIVSHFALRAKIDTTG